MKSVRIYVFAGPTISHEDAAREIDATFLGPVTQGDVYALTRERPWGIGIIDGYFERMPAVWHKEILWAMTHGIHVFGSSSMGALRAAELEPFGMIGVGRIFEAFRDGELDDDDEVAITHGPPESGYLQLSDAMVDIRATLQAADGVLAQQTRQELQRIAKSLHYMQRSYQSLIRQAQEEGLPAAELDRFREWLPGGRVDQKRADAIAMLRTMREQSSHPEPKEVRYQFQRTDAWEQVRRRIDRRPLDVQTGADTFGPDAVTDELRLRPADLENAWLRATVRAYALEHAHDYWHEVDEAAFEQGVAEFCRERDLVDAKRLGKYVEDESLEKFEFTNLIEDEVRIERSLRLMEGDVRRHLPATLRARGSFGELQRRAREKERALALRGLENPSLSDSGLEEAELWRWYFEDHLGEGVPKDLDAAVRRFRFRDCDAMRRVALREYLFTHPRSDES